MAYLINQAGRYVAIDDPADFEKWLQKPGFRRPSPDEEMNYIQQKTQMAKQMNEHVEPDYASGVYMATVTQGGKDGFGTSSGNILTELQAQGLNISLHNNGQKVALLYHNPYSILRLEAPYRILFTMFESDKLPDDWHDYLEAADKILVPSKFVQDAMKKAGFESEIVPLGYNHRVFKPKKRINKRERRQNFTFLHYNAFNLRKGFVETFEAFKKAFQPDEPVRMIFKTTLDQIPLPITKAEYPNIEVIKGKYTDQDLLDICYRSDCFVFPSRGEGFGMTPLEAMATGMPAIVPNAHGISEYFNSDCMYEAKVGGTCPGVYSRYKNQDVGKMVVCDVDELAKTMRHIYEHQDECLEMGVKAAEYAKNWTLEKTATKLKAILDNALSLGITERPLRNVLNLERVR